MVTVTLTMGHQANPEHCYKFHILQQICSKQYFSILFWDRERRQKARIDSQQYSDSMKIQQKFGIFSGHVY